MRNFFKYFVLISVVSVIPVLTGCDKNKQEDPTLSVNPDKVSINFTYEAAGSFIYDVITNQPSWNVEVTTGGEWCKAVKNEDGKSFTVTAEPNDKPESPAPATVTVTAGDAKPVVITVTQDGYNPSVTIDPNLKTISFYAGAEDTYSFEVFTEHDEWDYELDPAAAREWCKIERTGDILTVSGVFYNETTAREATLILKAGEASSLRIPVIQKGIEIFILGYQYNSGGSVDAKYWKNGKEFYMTRNQGNFFTNKMALHGDDVHAAVRIGGAGKSYAGYLKNNEEPVYLTLDDFGIGNDSNANDIFIDEEGNIYMCGYIGPVIDTSVIMPVWWKNDDRSVCQTDDPKELAAGIQIYEGATYIATYTSDKTIKYYKNGTANTIGQYGQIIGMKIEDGDIYTAGFRDNGNIYEPFYTKNQDVTYFNNTESEFPYGITVYNGDIYIAGQRGPGFDRYAIYWKNGEPTLLSDKLNSSAAAVAIWGDDVYVVGQEPNANDVMTGVLWKNGVRVGEISDGNNICYLNDIIIR